MESPITDESGPPLQTTTNVERLLSVAQWMSSDLIRILYDGESSEIRLGVITIFFSVVLPVRTFGKVRVALENARLTFSTPATRIEMIHDRSITRIPIKRMGKTGRGSDLYAGREGMSVHRKSSQGREFDAATEIEYAQCQVLTHRNRNESNPRLGNSVYEALIRKPNPYVDAVDDEISFIAHADFGVDFPLHAHVAAHLLITAEGEPTFVDHENTRLTGLARILAKRTYNRHRSFSEGLRTSVNFLVEVQQ